MEVLQAEMKMEFLGIENWKIDQNQTRTIGVVGEMHFYFARGETNYGSNPKNKYRVELTSV